MAEVKSISIKLSSNNVIYTVSFAQNDHSDTVSVIDTILKELYKNRVKKDLDEIIQSQI